jgi:hypothetical protein
MIAYHNGVLWSAFENGIVLQVKLNSPLAAYPSKGWRKFSSSGLPILTIVLPSGMSLKQDCLRDSCKLHEPLMEHAKPP